METRKTSVQSQKRWDTIWPILSTNVILYHLEVKNPTTTTTPFPLAFVRLLSLCRHLLLNCLLVTQSILYGGSQVTFQTCTPCLLNARMQSKALSLVCFPTVFCPVTPASGISTMSMSSSPLNQVFAVLNLFSGCVSVKAEMTNDKTIKQWATERNQILE